MNATDLDRLEQLLSAPHLADSLTLDALQGFFCAIASAPQPIPRAKWLASAMGDSKFANVAEESEVSKLMDKFAEDVARELGEGMGLDLLSYPVEDGEEEFAIWCEGYLLGVGLADPDWYSAGDPEKVDDLLYPFLLLSGHLKDHAKEEGEDWHEPEDEEKLMDEEREHLFDSIHEAWLYWFEKRVNRVPTKRDVPKVGRNDPCPCGSGKKYKACHGAP